MIELEQDTSVIGEIRKVFEDSRLASGPHTNI